jgi:CheY-like chemotaxis protein
MPTFYNVLILSITKEHSALLKFRANYYDLAMLDYLMPHLNGLELYRRIKDIFNNEVLHNHYNTGTIA